MGFGNSRGKYHAGHRLGISAGGWRRLSPSAELMVDPRSGARCAIRDTRAAGDERYYWTVTVIGEPDPVAAGRSGPLTVSGKMRSVNNNQCYQDKHTRFQRDAARRSECLKADPAVGPERHAWPKSTDA
jgi:hypothetical protein